MSARAAARPLPRPRERQPGTITALALTGVTIATVAWGLVASAAGVGLGTANPPFFVVWDPTFADARVGWALVFAAAVAAAVPFARGFGTPSAFLVAITSLGLAARLGLAAVRGGAESWYSVFGLDAEAANEYLPALEALEGLGLRPFLDRFAELSPSLPIHPSAHPPGTVLLADWLGADSPETFAALVIVAGILAVPLTWWAARRMGLGEGRARAAATMLAFSPAAMIYGVSSADALFATLGVLGVALLLGRGWGSRALGAVALAVASFFSWALLAIGAFAALLTALRDGIREGLLLATLAGLALLVFYLGLYAGSGYEPLGVLAAANEAYELGISNARPWAFWVLGSPVAFLLFTGAPVAWYAARALGTGNAIAVSLALVVVIAAVLGFSKAETERIWLFLGPLVCVAAATIVPRERLPFVIGLLAAQALLTELTVDTVW